MELLGLPCRLRSNHVPLASIFVFLGVESDFSRLQATHRVWLGVTVERQGRLREVDRRDVGAVAKGAGEGSLCREVSVGGGFRGVEMGVRSVQHP